MTHARSKTIAHEPHTKYSVSRAQIDWSAADVRPSVITRPVAVTNVRRPSYMGTGKTLRGSQYGRRVAATGMARVECGYRMRKLSPWEPLCTL